MGAISTSVNALSAGQAPVDVNVVRSITYLGADPTARNIKLGQLADAKARPAQAAALAAGAASSNVQTAAPVATEGAATSNGKQSAHGDGGNSRESASAKVDQTVAAAPDAQPVSNATTSGAAQINLGALTNAGVPTIQVSQIADVVGRVAAALSSQVGNASSSGETASVASMAPVKELDVQLNPASLGSLSIEMRLSNGNLKISIKAEKPDTVKLIDNERDAISDKLKSLNFSKLNRSPSKRPRRRRRATQAQTPAIQERQVMARPNKVNGDKAAKDREAGVVARRPRSGGPSEAKRRGAWRRQRRQCSWRPFRLARLRWPPTVSPANAKWCAPRRRTTFR